MDMKRYSEMSKQSTIVEVECTKKQLFHKLGGEVLRKKVLEKFPQKVMFLGRL